MTNANRIEKPWGWEEIIEQNFKYVVKKLFVKEGHQCSLQYHEYKTETIFVLAGVLNIKMPTQKNEQLWENILMKGDTMTLYPCMQHRMYGVTDCFYLECSTPELDDVVRIEDDYGRIQ